MATAKSILRVTHGEAIVKVAGTGAAEVIDLQADLIPLGPKNLGIGTITTTTGAASVVGVGTAFTAAWVGAKLYNEFNSLIGTVTSVADATHLTLTSNGAVAVTAGSFYIAYLSQELLSGASQRVNITGVTWTGAATSQISISRNGVVVMTLLGETATQMEFGGQMMIPDSINNDQDITVTISGAQAECWLKLRKVSGYKTHIEPEQYGSYDNPSVANA